jgi:uncharacterized protein
MRDNCFKGLRATLRDLATGFIASALMVVSMLVGADGLSDKPFAEQRLVLQMSSSAPRDHQAVLDIASNLLRHFGGPDLVDIEILTYGQGVQMVLAKAAQQSRIESLMAGGVRFYICENTLNTLQALEKREIAVLPGVQRVPSGIAYLLQQVDAGYKSVQP